MGVEYYFRGFVAITLVQQLGILVQIYIDPDSLQRAFLQQTLASNDLFVRIYILIKVCLFRKRDSTLCSVVFR